MGYRSKLGRLVLPAIGVGWLIAAALPIPGRAAVYTTGCASPSACTFQELLVGGEIIAGGQRFSSFEIEVDPLTIDWNKVVVTGLDDSGLAPGPGLQFSHNNEATIVDADCVDLQFSYRLTAVISNLQASGNELEMLAQTTAGSARIEVDESLFDASRTAVGEKTISADPTFDETRILDSIEFSPRAGLIVSNSIVIEGEAIGDQADLESFVQRFALTPVPEPSPILMLAAGAGLVACLAISRARAPRVLVEDRRRTQPVPVVHSCVQRRI